MKISEKYDKFINIELSDPYSLLSELKTRPRNDYKLVILHVGMPDSVARFAKEIRETVELTVPLVAESCEIRDRDVVMEYCDGYYGTIMKEENFERMLKDLKFI